MEWKRKPAKRGGTAYEFEGFAILPLVAQDPGGRSVVISYALYAQDQFVTSFTTVREAKEYARGMHYLNNEKAS